MWHTLYFQLMGFSDFTASVLASLFMLGTAAGGLLGELWGTGPPPAHPTTVASSQHRFQWAQGFLSQP